MSHFRKVEGEITDLSVLEKTIKNMGFEMRQNADCRYYYGVMQKERVIKLPGRYDCAVEKECEGVYKLNYDNYSEGRVEDYIGKDGKILLNGYFEEKLKSESKKIGYKVYGTNRKFKVCNPKNMAQHLEVVIDDDGKLTFEAKGFSGKSCMIFKNLENAMGVSVEYKENSGQISNDESLENKMFVKNY